MSNLILVSASWMTQVVPEVVQDNRRYYKVSGLVRSLTECQGWLHSEETAGHSLTECQGWLHSEETAGRSLTECQGRLHSEETAGRSLTECQGWLHSEETAGHRQSLTQSPVQLLKISLVLIWKMLCGKEMLLAVQWLRYLNDIGEQFLQRQEN